MTLRIFRSLLRWVRRTVMKPDVSQRWLDEQERSSWRNTYEGVHISWPIRKQQ